MKSENSHKDFHELFLRSIGADIKRTREGLGLTQAEFAELLGYDVRYLQRIESGNVSFKILTKVLFRTTQLNAKNQVTRHYLNMDESTSVFEHIKTKLISLLSTKP